MHGNLSGLIPIAVGIYVLLAVFRIVRLSKDPEANETVAAEVWPYDEGD